MGDPRGFLKVERLTLETRPVSERLSDNNEFVLAPTQDVLASQASRCMDCGIPFCHSGCPLGNFIPEWNDHVFRSRMDAALEALYATNNFPEVTGRVCPAPCEASCVLNIEKIPVTIKTVEVMVAAHALESGLAPCKAKVRTDKRVAIVGSGPAGLAAAQQLARAGHAVTVYERDDRLGGLLRYGIPDFKLEKGIIDLRIEQMAEEGVRFETSVDVGVDVTAEQLRADHDAVILAAGAREPRDLPVPGRELMGVHFAMSYLTQQNRRVAGDVVPDADSILATDKHVVVIGGGDTGSDCVGTANRQGARSVTQLELLPRPPTERHESNPWPQWPQVLQTSSSHLEGCERDWGVMTTALRGVEDHVRELCAVRVDMREGKPEPKAGTEFALPADLVLLAMGFVGPALRDLVDQLGLELTDRGNIKTTTSGATNVAGVYAAGDVARGQSLVVWAIADGRRVAAAVDAHLRGEAFIEDRAA